MKSSHFLLLLVSVTFVSFNKPKSLQLEGAWKLVYSKSISADTVMYQFPGDMTGSDLKVWTKNHFIFVGWFQMDTTKIDSYVEGLINLMETGMKKISSIIPIKIL